ncbi:Bug family tripartite tricarboxylate transporter substrate binding protein [Belnapia rosea]|uniref:Tripartite-type tricarboxylate transporter, receptor component TctC n=3 Tax=Belnapia rosea TaxID=938405 RepID=A0A1G7B2Z7_9PROT|nr:tripartite tricarboxylate transporter substrate-binding protein [Belnapia rosea]SDE20615.1 Tripartite-type tricarboxylate transporter, receptor component TctC [Belnapia rosea]
MNRRNVLGLPLAFATAGLPLPVRAQAAFPDRPMRMLIGFAAGGPTDIVGRRFADRLGAVLGQPVVVENRSGASGAIASVEAARARPDGYTLMLATSSSHAIYASLAVRPGFDPVTDYAPLALIGVVPMVIGAHPTFAADLPEVLGRIRAASGGIAIATSGNGGIAHFAAELLLRQAGGLRANLVHYRGGGPAVQDAIAGHVPAVVETFATTLEHHRAGRLRILAAFTEQRSAAAPEVPTAIEQGVPGMLANTYNALLAPAGTPAPVVARLAEASAEAAAEPEFQAFLRSVSVEPVPGSTPARTADFIRSERAKWEPIIRATGLRIE